MFVRKGILSLHLTKNHSESQDMIHRRKYKRNIAMNNNKLIVTISLLVPVFKKAVAVWTYSRVSRCVNRRGVPSGRPVSR